MAMRGSPSPQAAAPIEVDLSIDETRFSVSEEPMDITVAKHKLKGLILHTHQKSGEKGDGSATGPLMDERSRAAMDDLFNAQAKLGECKELLQVQQRRMRDLDANKSQLEEAIAEAESELRLEGFLPLGKPRFIEQHLAELRKELALVEEESSAQIKAVDNTLTHILHYENEALRADGNIRISKPAQGPDLRKQAHDREEQEAIAGMRVQAELRGALQLRDLETDREVLRNEKLKEVEVKIAKQIEVAARSHRTALARILETERERRKWVAVMVEKDEQKHQDRVDAILELKANTEKAAADIRGLNERAEKLRLAKQKAHEREKQALVEAGHNPYVVFKQRDIDRDAARRKAELEARILSRQEAMASKIIKDMDYERKETENMAADKEYERMQREQLGRHVIEEANRQYLIEHTTAKVDIIDPTGRALRLDPSQVTTMVDGAFGLGYHPRKDTHQMGQVLELVRSNPAYQDVDLGEFTRLLPKRVADEEARGSGKDNEGGPAWLDTFLTPKKATPGQELVAEFATQVCGQEAGISGQDEDSSLQESSHHGTGAAREMSKFELDCLEKARRQRQESLENGTPQVVGNRVFQGPAFVCRPGVIEFKDFTINKPHKKRIQLTNVSLAFNRFKLRDLPDDIRDLFDISYERPGRMCPGLTCAIEIIFTPRVRADIRSELCLLTETGPISIPLVCTYPRVVPSLDISKVIFDNVVKGEKAFFNLTIRNDGALPTAYTITPRDAAADVKHSATVPAAAPQSPMSGESYLEEKAKEGETAVSGAGNCAEGTSTERELVELAARKRLEWLKGATKGGGIFRLQESGQVAPYSKVTHAITFAPVDVGTFSSHYLVSFSHCDGGGGVLELELHGTATDVPIHIPDSLHDLRCCIYNKLYRKDVTINNRGKIAYKVQTIVPKQLQGMLEFSPTMGFVQPGGEFLLQMKFKPDESALLKQGGRYIVKKEDGSIVMAVPVQVGVPNQVVPLFFTLKARLTPGTLLLSKHEIPFGDCFTSESYKTVVQIKNQSHLPQKVGFLAVPSCIVIKPNDGFILLLPQEERSVEVLFSPTSATRHDVNLILRTSLNQSYRLHVTAQGLEPPVLLSHTVLRLPPACPGDMVSHDLQLNNRSKAEQVLEFAVPHPSRSHLRLAPVVVGVPPGCSRRITLWFCPPADQNEDTCPHADASPVKAEPDTKPEGMEGSFNSTQASGPQLTSASKAGKGPSTPLKVGPAKSGKAGKQVPPGDIPAAAVTTSMPLAMPPELSPEEGTVCYSSQAATEEHEELEPEAWSRHARWSVPCFIRSLPSPSASSPPPAPADDTPIGMKHRFVTLQVHTTTVQRDLELEPTSINFGELAVGQKKVVAVRVRNQSCVQADLEVVRGLNACGNFSVVNAVRPVPADGGIRTLLVQFLPVTHGILTEVMLFRSPNLGKDLYIKLQGEGVNTALQLTPEDGRLDMGNVLEGRSVTQTLTMRNTSPFSLRFEIRPVAPSHENFTHQLPIQCLPSEATIAPGESKAVEVTFSPDHARIWSYEQAFQVVVPGQTEKQFLQVRGRSWRRQLYVHAAEPADDTEQRVSRTQEDPLVLPLSLEALDNASAKALGLSQRPLHDIRLRFPRQNDTVRDSSQAHQAVTRRIIVGSAAMPGGGSSAGTFEVELGEDARKAGAATPLFSVTPDKGPVAPDARVELVFTYKPVTQEKPAGGLVVGQWVKYPFRVHLKGGYRPPSDAEVVSVNGILEAFVYV